MENHDPGLFQRILRMCKTPVASFGYRRSPQDNFLMGETQKCPKAVIYDTIIKLFLLLAREETCKTFLMQNAAQEFSVGHFCGQKVPVPSSV